MGPIAGAGLPGLIFASGGPIAELTNKLTHEPPVTDVTPPADAGDHHINGSQELRCDSRQRMKASACETEFDLVVMADAWKSEQLEHEFAQPCRVMREVNISGHIELHRTCPLLDVKRTSACALHMSAFDPKRTFRSTPFRN